jgi:hypothetical protein
LGRATVPGRSGLERLESVASVGEVEAVAAVVFAGIDAERWCRAGSVGVVDPAWTSSCTLTAPAPEEVVR